MKIKERRMTTPKSNVTFALDLSILKNGDREAILEAISNQLDATLEARSEAVKKSFDPIAWVTDTNPLTTLRGIFDKATSADNNCIESHLIWRRMFDGGVLSEKEVAAKYKSGNVAALRHYVVLNIINYLCDNEVADFYDVFSFVQYKGNLHGRCHGVNRIYLCSNAAEKYGGLDESKVFAAMKKELTYCKAKYINGVDSLTDGNGNPLTESESNRLCAIIDSTLRNAKIREWNALMKKATVFNTGYRPDCWTDLK